MAKNKNHQHKPVKQPDQKKHDDFSKIFPNPNDPDFQKPNPNKDFPSIGDFQNEHIDDTIIGKIDGRDNDEREDEPANKKSTNL
ncbi:MAG: hypothetical protein SH848_06025 [Saprospiraceae bacterium]|nr:hypothetical protein [Saprospiraceae bacterium]MDZ4703464.1 hypothetical protein [Saprospiraceae bacterium]